MFSSHVPGRDAEAVRRARDAGAILAGKTQTHEFAWGITSVNVLMGTSRNPWALDRMSGGSSGGSAVALAAHLVPLALGSDTGGSIRGPAAHCGVVGIRPTYGRVSRRGVLALCWSLDTAGPLAPSARDCALILGAIAGHDPADPGSADVPVPDYAAALGRGLAGTRVGVDRRHFFHAGIEGETLAAVEAALEVLRGLGARIEEVELPALDDAPAALHAIHASESHAYHAERLARAPELYGPTARAYFRVGALVGAADYLRAQRVRARIRRELLAALERVDLLATPTQNGPAERFEAIAPGPERFARASPMQPFSLAGLPAVSVPCGFSSAGLPIGLQLAGRPFEESTVLAGADAYELATPWHTMHPPLA
jgi:aspartyl-tRNA(Asn)/glutamyl-tRNA(Gln) amidotransferase subunit A